MKVELVPTTNIVLNWAQRTEAHQYDAKLCPITVRSKDGMVVITWRLGDRVLDTGFRADATADHATVLDGLMGQFPMEVQ